MVEFLLFVEPMSWALFLIFILITVVSVIVWFLHFFAVDEFKEEGGWRIDVLKDRVSECTSVLAALKRGSPSVGPPNDRVDTLDRLEQRLDALSEGSQEGSKIKYLIEEAKQCKKYSIIMVILTVVMLALSQGKSGIINVYGYRAVTSETAEKAIMTINTVLDRVNDLAGGEKGEKSK